MTFAGFDLSMIPKNGRAYETHRESAWPAARSVPMLVSRDPEFDAAIDDVAIRSGQSKADLRLPPLLSRQVNLVVLMARPDAARSVGYVPVDGFFR